MTAYIPDPTPVAVEVGAMNPPPSEDLQVVQSQQQCESASSDGGQPEGSERPDQTSESTESIPLLAAALASWQAAQSIVAVTCAAPSGPSSSRVEENDEKKRE